MSGEMGWRGDWVRDGDGKPIVNATPSRHIDPEVVGPWGSLAWSLLMCSSASQDGGFSCKWPAPEAARRLWPWLIATGWTPPDGESPPPPVSSVLPVGQVNP